MCASRLPAANNSNNGQTGICSGYRRVPGDGGLGKVKGSAAESSGPAAARAAAVVVSSVKDDSDDQRRQVQAAGKRATDSTAGADGRGRKDHETEVAGRWHVCVEVGGGRRGVVRVGLCWVRLGADAAAGASKQQQQVRREEGRKVRADQGGLTGTAEETD